MHARRGGVPIDVLHEYMDGAATFQVRIAGLIPMVNKSGIGITHDETVTLMNDVLVLAPAAALDLPFTLELDERSVRATFRNVGEAKRLRQFFHSVVPDGDEPYDHAAYPCYDEHWLAADPADPARASLAERMRALGLFEIAHGR